MHGRTIHWVKAKNSRQACVFRSTANVGFGSRPCENSNARRARRNILEKLRVLRTDNAADIRLDAMSENCVFYISPMYEFSHSLGPDSDIGTLADHLDSERFRSAPRTG